MDQGCLNWTKVHCWVGWPHALFSMRWIFYQIKMLQNIMVLDFLIPKNVYELNDLKRIFFLVAEIGD